MKTRYLRLSSDALPGAIGLMLLAACANTAAADKIQAEARQAEARIEKLQQDKATSHKSSAIEGLTINQVEPVGDDDKGVPGQLNRLTVDQLSKEKPSQYAFDVVQGDHPCGGQGDGAENCLAVSRNVAKAASQRAGERQASAEAELQTLTNRVIDPETFDPESTIDEIGRGGVPNSLAAQSIGAALLGPRAEDLPIEDEAAEVNDGAPPLARFDATVTVTQDN